MKDMEYKKNYNLIKFFHPSLLACSWCSSTDDRTKGMENRNWGYIKKLLSSFVLHVHMPIMAWWWRGWKWISFIRYKFIPETVRKLNYFRHTLNSHTHTTLHADWQKDWCRNGEINLKAHITENENHTDNIRKSNSYQAIDEL